MLEKSIQELLKRRNNSGYIMIDDYLLDKEEMIEAYKRFILDWIKDNCNQVRQIKLLAIWNTY